MVLSFCTQGVSFLEGGQDWANCYMQKVRMWSPKQQKGVGLQWPTKPGKLSIGCLSRLGVGSWNTSRTTSEPQPTQTSWAVWHSTSLNLPTFHLLTTKTPMVKEPIKLIDHTKPTNQTSPNTQPPQKIAKQQGKKNLFVVWHLSKNIFRQMRWLSLSQNGLLVKKVNALAPPSCQTT